MTTSRAIGPLLLVLAMASAVALTGASRASAAETGAISINLTLQAGPDAAARTWRFEVVNTSGTVVETLTAGTSGDRLATTVTTGAIPRGFYTVRQVLTNDTKATCDGGAFYEVTAPVGASTVVELAGSALGVQFVIRPCAALPRNLEVNMPIDTITPAGPGVIGDADVLPEVPINEVRGARSEGPGEPLAPGTGNTMAASGGDSVSLSLLLALGATLTAVAPAAMATAAVRHRSRR